VSTGEPDVVSVREGGSVVISCTSTGVPVPTISWTFNNLTTRFNQNDKSTEVTAFVTAGGVVDITQGSVDSSLQIVAPQYPADDGVYVCVGSNTHAGNTATSSAMITVQVLGEWVCPTHELVLMYLRAVSPEVNVSADRTRVGPGGSATLTCTVTRGNPMNYTYSWFFGGNPLPEETSATLSLTSFNKNSVGVYRCEVRNGEGAEDVGMDSITLTLGGEILLLLLYGALQSPVPHPLQLFPL